VLYNLLTRLERFVDVMLVRDLVHWLTTYSALDQTLKLQ